MSKMSYVTFFQFFQQFTISQLTSQYIVAWHQLIMIKHETQVSMPLL